MANFELVPALRQLVDVLVNVPKPRVGDKLPISIRKRYPSHQTIVLFPEDGYNFFVPGEISRVLAAADILCCDVVISARGDVPTIEISSWFNSIG